MLHTKKMLIWRWKKKEFCCLQCRQDAPSLWCILSLSWPLVPHCTPLSGYIDASPSDILPILPLTALAGTTRLRPCPSLSFSSLFSLHSCFTTAPCSPCRLLRVASSDALNSCHSATVPQSGRHALILAPTLSTHMQEKS
jgi:hypothetical protein